MKKHGLVVVLMILCCVLVGVCAFLYGRVYQLSIEKEKPIRVILEQPIKVISEQPIPVIQEKSTTAIQETTTVDQARKIMGKNFFGIDEAIKYFGVKPTTQQLTALSRILFPKKLLEQVKDSCILEAVFPVSIASMFMNKNMNSILFYYLDWYREEPFFLEQGEVSWQLIYKTPITIVNDTMVETLSDSEQQVLDNKYKEMPTARIMAYTIIGHFLNTTERLFDEYDWICTSSMTNCGEYKDSGKYVAISFHYPENLRFTAGLNYRVKVAYSRKPSTQITK